jgi:hypothetical protein
MSMAGEAGWSGYYSASDDDDGEDGLSGVQFMAGIGGLDYNPSLAPVGSGSGYYPGSVDADADALNFLGYGAGFPGGGNGQREDMDRAEGAWDTTFKAAVTSFQGNAGLKADGWIGPATRTALKAAVDRQNQIPSAPGALPAPMPPPGVLPNFAPVPSQPSRPASPSSPSAPAAHASLFTQRNLIIGGAILAALGVGYVALK